MVLQVFSECITINLINYLLLSLTHVMVEKVLFLGQIFQMDILMDLQHLGSLKSENYILTLVGVCVCLQHNFKINSKFTIFYMHHMYILLEIFMKI